MTGEWAWWHDFFEILGGIAAAIAVGFSVWVTFQERADRQKAEDDRDEARRAERAALEREARREREGQARRVVLWATPQWSSRVGGGNQWVVFAGVANYSDMVVTNVRLSVGEEVATISDGQRQLAPGTHLQPGVNVTAVLTATDGSRLELDAKPRRIDITLEFVDAAGAKWRRTAEGSLEQLGA